MLSISNLGLLRTIVEQPGWPRLPGWLDSCGGPIVRTNRPTRGPIALRIGNSPCPVYIAPIAPSAPGVISMSATLSGRHAIEVLVIDGRRAQRAHHVVMAPCRATLNTTAWRNSSPATCIAVRSASFGVEELRDARRTNDGASRQETPLVAKSREMRKFPQRLTEPFLPARLM